MASQPTPWPRTSSGPRQRIALLVAASLAVFLPLSKSAVGAKDPSSIIKPCSGCQSDNLGTTKGSDLAGFDCVFCGGCKQFRSVTEVPVPTQLEYLVGGEPTNDIIMITDNTMLVNSEKPPSRTTADVNMFDKWIWCQPPGLNFSYFELERSVPKCGIGSDVTVAIEFLDNLPTIDSSRRLIMITPNEKPSKSPETEFSKYFNFEPKDRGGAGTVVRSLMIYKSQVAASGIVDKSDSEKAKTDMLNFVGIQSVYYALGKNAEKKCNQISVKWSYRCHPEKPPDYHALKSEWTNLSFSDKLVVAEKAKSLLEEEEAGGNTPVTNKCRDHFSKSIDELKKYVESNNDV